MPNISPLEHPAEYFGGFDRSRSHQDRLFFGVGFLDVLDDLVVLLPASLKHKVIQVIPHTGSVGRDDHDSKAINIVKFSGFCFCRTRHAGELFIHPEVILDSDGCVGFGLLLNHHPFLCLYGLV